MKLDRKELFARGGLAILLIIVLLSAFWTPIASDEFLAAPDLSLLGFKLEKEFLADRLVGTWDDHMLGRPFAPTSPLPRKMTLFFMSPMTYHLWAFIIDVLLLFAATYYLLLGKGLKRIVAFFGALAMAFAGHSFTLIAAGHLSKFGMMPFAVLTFALLDRAIERRSAFYFVLLGCAAGIGLAEHQDVMMMFCLLAAFYGLFKLVVSVPSDAKGKYVSSMSLGIVAAGLFFAALSLPTFMGAVGIAIEERDSITGQSEEDKWDFATGWSLPPEDIVEFAAPCVYGVETSDKDLPYWGRLGRSKGWEAGRGGLRNLRQHSVYLGIIQICLALFAVSLLFVKKNGRRADVAFWLVAWLICVMLALGRYGPFGGLPYRLFYSLPYASGIRAPVKFMHLVELATVILSAYGLEHLMASASDKAKKRFAIGVGVAGALFIVGMLWAGGRPGALVSYWAETGFAGYEKIFSDGMASAFGRTGLICLIFASLIWGWGKAAARPKLGTTLSVVLLLLLAVDLVSVAKKYVKCYDAEPLYESNLIVETLKKDSHAFRVMALGNDPLSRRFIRHSLPYYGFDTMDMAVMSGLGPDYKRFFKALGSSGLRPWQLMNIRYLLVPGDRAEQFVSHPAFEQVLSVAFAKTYDGKIIMNPVPMNQAHLVLFRNLSALPRVCMYYGWESGGADSVHSRIGVQAWDPFKSVLVEGDEDVRVAEQGVIPVAVTDFGVNRIAFSVEAVQDAVILVNSRHNDGWTVTVDGNPSELLRCNSIMFGTRVSAGSHKLVFSYDNPHGTALLLRMAALVAVLCLLCGKAVIFGIKMRNANGSTVEN